MSIESAKAFLERVENDEDFKKELEGQASVEERMKYAKAQGFDFTTEEIREVSEKLSELQLDVIYGGIRMQSPGCLAGSNLNDK